ncbi:GNAT family N-acetyltransferase [Ramlibacter sp. WS9]|uniref:GNAT family N-acetyltransferase n=1 Tax=Ramlibacter sp. WS9 TaxID=1882741 RepID=UPI001E437C14|nr:GNAT family N-acetyltransferase [Ramlibacter sp. WS9]
MDGFDCGKPSLNEWLARHARQASASGSARAFAVVDDANDARTVAGYYSLAVGQVDSLEVPERVRKGMGQYPIPVVLLARLAVDQRYHGQGVGQGLLRDAITRALTISEQAGVRAMMTHPLDAEAISFYLKFGFIPSPAGEGMLLLLLKDAQRLLLG